MSWTSGVRGGAATIGIVAAVCVSGMSAAAGRATAGLPPGGAGTREPTADVTYQVSAAAQRAALAFWTPGRMRMTAAARTVPRLSGTAQLPQAEATPPKGIPTAVRFTGARTVGALFYTTGGKRHFCTAAVVDSRAGDLVLTAAHCVYRTGYATNIAYVPQYHEGQRPYGVWTVRSITVAAGWRRSHDPDLDFAFLAVGSARSKIQARTGGLTIGFNRWYTEQKIQVIGHNDTDDEPVHCATRSFKFRAGQMEFYCHGYSTGTSGGPWILGYNARTGTGTVYGVIGGYQAGGDYEWASYSPYFGAAARALYQLAERPAPAPSPTGSPSPTGPSPAASPSGSPSGPVTTAYRPPAA